MAITNPASGAVFAAPANVTIQASASDTDGTVTNVQFLDRLNRSVTNEHAAPYSAVASNLAAGSYTLSAIASDNGGATATNQVTISVVTPAPLTAQRSRNPLPPAKFKFSYTANAGLSYIVQSSSNLVSPNWITLVTNMAASEFDQFHGYERDARQRVLSGRPSAESVMVEKTLLGCRFVRKSHHGHNI